jgi:hypothetical protein
MLFIIMQQLQPAFIMPIMQSQQAWIMAQQALSPLVQVMRMPLSVASQRHMAIARLQQQTIIPFIMQQQEHIPPAIIVQRFCIIAADALSSQTQSIVIPPSHLAKVMVHFGTITMPMPAGAVPVDPIMPAGDIMPAPMPDIPIALRSIIIVVMRCPLQVHPQRPEGNRLIPLGQSRNAILCHIDANAIGQPEKYQHTIMINLIIFVSLWKINPTNLA